MRLEHELDKWGDYMTAASLSEETLYLRRRHVYRVLTHINKPLDDLTLDDLIDWLAQQNWKPETRRGYRSSLRQFFAWREKAGLGENIARDLPRARLHRSLPRPARDVDILLALRKAPARTQLMIELMAYGGLRRGEVCKLRTCDLVGDTLRVVGKGGHERHVPLPPHLSGQIRGMTAGYLFPGRIDGHLSAAYVGKLIGRALPVGVTPHQLRHRFATVAYRKGRDIVAVQSLLGHAKLDTTMIYVALDDSARQQSAQYAWTLEAA